MSQSTDKTGRYWLVYGFGESTRHAKYFHVAMRTAGFKPASSFAQADIIIAHSGGCLDLPPAPGKLVFLCQPAAGWQHSAWYIWYQKTLLEVAGHYNRGLLHRWLWKVGLNLYNLARHPRQTQRIVHLAKQHRLQLPEVTAKRLVTVINKHDPWSNLITMDTMQQHASGDIYLGLNGTHDELWTYPQPLTRLIKATYET